MVHDVEDVGGEKRGREPGHGNEVGFTAING